MCFIYYYHELIDYYSDRSDMSTEQAYTFDQQIYNKYILYYELIFIYRFKIIYYIPSNSLVDLCLFVILFLTIASELSKH